MMNEDQQRNMLNDSAALVQRMQHDLFQQSVPSPCELRALTLLERNVPVTLLRPESKIAILSDWQLTATTDLAKVREWIGQLGENCNVAAVCKAEPGGIWIFELDRENFDKMIEQQTGEQMPKTLVICSSPGRYHYYFAQTDASIQMGNLNGKDETGREVWSARVSNRYCVGPLSVHPTTKKQYELFKDSPIAPAPGWLIQWCQESSKNHVQTRTVETGTAHVELDDDSPIYEPGRNSALTSILGRARQVEGLDRDQLRERGLEVNERRCKPPLDPPEVERIADSVSRYPIKLSGPSTVILGSQQQPTQIVVPKLNTVPYPEFPTWVMPGTSIFEHFVKPICAQNNRIDFFMWLPAAALVMNYLGGKVRVEHKAWTPGICMILIGEKGRAIKSSSVNDACEYMMAAGVLGDGEIASNADGKSLMWTPASTEGLGLEMRRTSCHNVVLVYDELSLITAKAGIDCSSLKSHLLALAESGRFSNTLKSKKQAFHFAAGSYCASLIACTTNEIFQDEWSKLAGKSTGLDDRFVFVLQPKELPPLKSALRINTLAGAMKTRELIDRAVQQKVYEIDDMSQFNKAIGKLGNRVTVRAEKWSLLFAVDLGRDSIDEDCCQRGLAVAEFELAVKKYLGSPECESKIASAQLKYRRILEREYEGKATEREMERSMNYIRYGTDGWWRIFEGLVKAGIIGQVVADGKKSVYIIKALDED
jgi:hypothetical protein